MRTRRHLPALATLTLLCGAVPALALIGVPGGVQAPSRRRRLAASARCRCTRRHPVRPVVASLSVPRTATPACRRGWRCGSTSPVWPGRCAGGGERPLDPQAGGGGEPRLGAHRPHDVTWRGRRARRWRRAAYQVSVSAHDRRGATLLRGAHSSGVASLTVNAPAPAPTKAPAPSPTTPPTPPPAVEAGVPTVAQTVADGAVFPVAGPHNFGGPENLFGAPRDGYLHQGQDVLTAEGTPVVAPLAGTILTTSYQAGGAGYYAVEQTAIGFDFMFAHCQAGSLAVEHRPGGVGRAGAVQGRPDGRRDGAAPGLRDVGRRLAGRHRAPDQPAAVPGGVGRVARRGQAARRRRERRGPPRAAREPVASVDRRRDSSVGRAHD